MGCEGSETFTVDLSNATNASISDAQGVGTIVDDGTNPPGGGSGSDDDRPTLSVAPSSSDFVEGTDTHVEWTISIDVASTEDVVMNLAVTDGGPGANDAAAGSDYTNSLEVSTDGGATWVAASAATISAGSTSVLARVPVLDDALNELNNEELSLTASVTSGTVTNVGSVVGVANIDDDDGLPNLSIDDVTVNEADGTATFTVTLSAASALPVTVDYQSNDGTAVDPSDFTDTSGTLTFNAGVTSQTITVSIIDDDGSTPVYEGSETFTVEYSAFRE